MNQFGETQSSTWQSLTYHFSRLTIRAVSQFQSFCASVAFIFATETLKHRSVAFQMRSEKFKLRHFAN